jgi:hypothetical protein
MAEWRPGLVGWTDLGALGPSFLGLPVVVAGAGALVAVEARRHAEALSAALVAEGEAGLRVLRLRAPRRALGRALPGLQVPATTGTAAAAAVALLPLLPRTCRLRSKSSD